MRKNEKTYIEKVLGVSVEYHRWKGEVNLPYYITERYDMRLVQMDTLQCIFVWPKEKLNQISSLKKQIRRIQMEEALPVVFILERMDRYHRDAFISSHIPFVVAENQLYLPFMALYLKEKYLREIKSSDSFLPFTQLLLFYWYYHKKNTVYMSDMIQILECSAMTVTRAFRQLEESGMFESGKAGVQRMLTGKQSAETILVELEDSLINPIAAVLYVDKKELAEQISSDKLFLSENSALKALGINVNAELPCYAVYKKNICLKGSRELLNAETQIKLELWKYDPSILGKEQVVDPLSLALSMNKPVDSFLKNS